MLPPKSYEPEKFGLDFWKRREIPPRRQVIWITEIHNVKFSISDCRGFELLSVTMWNLPCFRKERWQMRVCYIFFLVVILSHRWSWRIRKKNSVERQSKFLVAFLSDHKDSVTGKWCCLPFVPPKRDFGPKRAKLLSVENAKIFSRFETINKLYVELFSSRGSDAALWRMWSWKVT